MPRASIASPAQIRSTILAMLAEAHDASPATRERFRRVVSVRKLKDRLGGGDPATLGRAINAVESEIVTAGLADIASHIRMSSSFRAIISASCPHWVTKNDL